MKIKEQNITFENVRKLFADSNIIGVSEAYHKTGKEFYDAIDLLLLIKDNWLLSVAGNGIDSYLHGGKKSESETKQLISELAGLGFVEFNIAVIRGKSSYMGPKGEVVFPDFKLKELVNF